jgi:hypothetical protein
MSGGHFDYRQYGISTIAETVESLIIKNNIDEVNEYGDNIGHRFTPETIEEFEKGLAILKQAFVYAQRIDWLVSGDDGEDTFHQRLKHDLDKLGEW